MAFQRNASAIFQGDFLCNHCLRLDRFPAPRKEAKIINVEILFVFQLHNYLRSAHNGSEKKKSLTSSE
jgi:hypothetical protein